MSSTYYSSLGQYFSFYCFICVSHFRFLSIWISKNFACLHLEKISSPKHFFWSFRGKSSFIFSEENNVYFIVPEFKERLFAWNYGCIIFSWLFIVSNKILLLILFSFRNKLVSSANITAVCCGTNKSVSLTSGDSTGVGGEKGPRPPTHTHTEFWLAPRLPSSTFLSLKNLWN